MLASEEERRCEDTRVVTPGTSARACLFLTSRSLIKCLSFLSSSSRLLQGKISRLFRRDWCLLFVLFDKGFGGGVGGQRLGDGDAYLVLWRVKTEGDS